MAERTGLDPGDHHAKLRRVFLTLWPDASQQRALACRAEQLVTCIEQGLGAVAADILQLKGDAAGGAEFLDRGRIGGENHRFLAGHEDRKRGGWGKSVSVRLALGGSGIIK